MSFAFRSALLVAALAWAVPCAHGRELVVCADPDNLPYSRADGSGFENRIARLVADEMGAALRYAWQPFARGYVRKTLGAGLCDVLVGVPHDFDRVLTTRAYYRSSYVFVDGAAARGIDAFDDARLAHLVIGVQLVGNDLAATPAGHALTQQGYADNVRGFALFGASPSAQRMVDALVEGAIDTALVWGPQAGWFAQRASLPLEVHVARPAAGRAAVPLEFDIAMGVRRGDTALRDELDTILARRQSTIDAILAAYAVPRTDRPHEGSP